MCRLRDIGSSATTGRKSAEPVAIGWVGINHFARAGDADLRIALSAYGRYLRDRGDAGLLACGSDGEIAGWVWVRVGPYVERAGCGFLKISHHTRVVRDLKVHPDIRGRGLGHRLITELVRRLPIDPALETIAFIAPENARSLACVEAGGFERAGFVETRRIGGFRLTRALRTK